MRAHPTTLLFGLLGALLGGALLGLDAWVETLETDAQTLNSAIEVLEVLIYVPGFAVVGMLIADRIRLLRTELHNRRRSEHARRLQVLGRLAASMAHEIRNPLHNMRLILDELRESHPVIGRDPLYPALDDGIRRIDHAVAMVYRMARPAVRTDATCDAGQVVPQVIADQIAAGVSAGLIAWDPPPGPMLARCADDDLRMMLGNLLRNACEGRSGGQISITVAHSSETIVVTVCNPGELGPMFRLGDDEPIGQSTKTGGLGAGLLIVSELATAYNGSLSVVQDGALVRAQLMLPIATAAA